MAKRKIVWTRTAALQRRKILEYWINRNGSAKYSKNLIRITAEHLQVISLHPEAFVQTELDDVRESAMGHFSIYYKFQKETIIVVAFWNNRQDPEKLFKLISL